MTSLIIATAQALAAISLTAFIIVLVACSMWHIVYYGFACRRNPIGKTAALTAVAIWIISVSIINFA